MADSTGSSASSRRDVAQRPTGVTEKPVCPLGADQCQAVIDARRGHTRYCHGHFENDPVLTEAVLPCSFSKCPRADRNGTAISIFKMSPC